MKHRKTRRRIISFFVLLAMLVTMIPGMTLTALAANQEQPVHQEYGDFTFDKISNPDTTCIKDPDGLNTNDETGFDANRLNSYAWAVTTRGENIYIGTNRTLFGSALNAVAADAGLNAQLLGALATIVSGGDVPVNLPEKDYIPQIIKFDVANGSTKVIYQPATRENPEDEGRLYYTDQAGNIVDGAAVTSEAASYRSVVQFKGNMYFGSLGSHMLQLVRVDENDHADVVFQTIGLVSSLRAGCVYDDGEGETVYFGGQDTTYYPWLEYRAMHPEDQTMLPIVIRRLDPATAGTDHEDWNEIIADFNDFPQYAHATVYRNGGGNVWDLCSYNGKLYLILAYDGGWAMFRGEKGGANPNDFGWTWTEIVGDNGNYPLAMIPEVKDLNEEYAREYGCADYNPQALNGTGLLESTATPYVFNGKMYIGSFDNATTIQTQTVIKALVKLQTLMNPESWRKGDFGPTLTQIFAPIEAVLSHQQHVWVMDENENITAVESANQLLAGTTNDYVWRFIEHNGKLYTGTFDSSTAFIYFLDYSLDRIVSLLEQGKANLSEQLQQLLDGRLSERLRELFSRIPPVTDLQQRFQTAALNAAASAEGFLDDTVSVEKLSEDLEELEAVRDEMIASGESLGLTEEASAESMQAVSEETEDDAKGEEDTKIAAEEDPSEPLEAVSEEGGDSIVPEETAEETASEDVSNEAAYADTPEGDVPAGDADVQEANGIIDWLRDFFEGIGHWARARRIVLDAEQGFDIFVTEDGENWDAIVRNGLEDPYNYGARTFTRLNNELYVGTANPYYGAQLWKVTGEGTNVDPAVIVPPAPIPGLVENGSAQNLVTPGTAYGDGTMYYALGTDDKTPPTSGWSTAIPTGTKAGTYYIWYKATLKVGQVIKETTPAVVKNTIGKKADPQPQPGGNTDPGATGDQNNALTWIIILCASLAAIIAAFLVFRKKLFRK